VRIINPVLNVTNPVPDFFREQAALYNVMEKYKFQDHFKWMPQRLFNAYPDASCKRDKETCLYQPGDFLIHFPGHSGVNWFEGYVKDNWIPKITDLNEEFY
jgi:hypothetical protein